MAIAFRDLCYAVTGAFACGGVTLMLAPLADSWTYPGGACAITRMQGGRYNQDARGKEARADAYDPRAAARRGRAALGA